ncbi:uncharacterized protein LOC111612601 [Centruroides sculpturatus]|uniref:uncharacterized protein LOC111612601 n=1 Tax=Centruroides sculpturatus TaxID=218467 RepID=UPI000C6D79E4|nr:uncharacterized protein LOC111612601 [Centruroides sculpturatus]
MYLNEIDKQNSSFYEGKLILCGSNLKNNMHIIGIWSRTLKDRPFQCQYCRRTFNTRAELENHINSQHKDPRKEIRSGESLKHEEYRRAYGEHFSLHRGIILHDLFSEEIFATFKKLQADFDNSERSSLENKTKKYFKSILKIEDKDELKVEGPEMKNIKANEKQNSAEGPQTFTFESVDIKSGIGKVSD